MPPSVRPHYIYQLSTERLRSPSPLDQMFSPFQVTATRENPGTMPLTLFALLLFRLPFVFTLRKFEALPTSGERTELIVDLNRYDHLSPENLFSSDFINPTMSFSSSVIISAISSIVSFE